MSDERALTQDESRVYWGRRWWNAKPGSDEEREAQGQWLAALAAAFSHPERYAEDRLTDDGPEVAE